jgi:hypothetical protein
MATFLEITKALYAQMSETDKNELKSFIKDFDGKFDYEKKTLKESFSKKYMLGPTSGISSGGTCALCGK